MTSPHFNTLQSTTYILFIEVPNMTLTCMCTNVHKVLHACTVGFLHQIQSCTSNNGYWIHFLSQAEALFCEEVERFQHMLL